MKLWIAREKCGFVYLFTFEPEYNNIYGSWESYDSEQIELGILCFPEVTFENSPQEVELTLCNHIDTVNI